MEQPIIANGELQYIPQIAMQYVNLDFDGELTSYNGGILTVEDIAVSADTLMSESSAYEYSHISKNFSSVVSFFDKGTNQTIMATVNLTVDLNLSLNIGANDDVFTNICYAGEWNYTTSVSIDWGDQCPWSEEEKQKQLQLVKDSIYVESLNIRVDNESQNYHQNLAHYNGKESGTFGVEFAEGWNTVSGEITVTGDYIPTYEITVDTVQEQEIKIGRFVSSNDTALMSKNATDTYTTPAVELVECKITKETFTPNYKDWLPISLSIKVDPNQYGEYNQEYKITLSYGEVVRTRTASFTIHIAERSITVDDDSQNFFSGPQLTQVTVDYEDVFFIQSDVSAPINLTLTVNSGNKTVNQTVAIKANGKFEACWTHCFLAMVGLKRTDDNHRQLIEMQCYGTGTGKEGSPIKACQTAGIKINSDKAPTIAKIEEKLNSGQKVFLWTENRLGEGAHWIFVTAITKNKDNQYQVTCLDTGFSKDLKTFKIKDTENSVIITDSKNVETIYTLIGYAYGKTTLTQEDFNKKFPPKTEITIGTRSSYTDSLVSENAMQLANNSYHTTITNIDYAHAYITDLNIAFANNTSLDDVWIREGSRVGILDGATISNSWVSEDSVLVFEAGATLEGTLSVSGKVIFETPIQSNNASLELDISGRTVNDSVLIDGFSNLGDIAVTVQVATYQTAGKYLIAENVSAYSKELSIHAVDAFINEDMVGHYVPYGELGSVKLNETLEAGLGNYTFTISNDKLYLNISYDAPVDGIRPTTPTLSVKSESASQVTLQWTPSSDANGISCYIVEYSLNADFSYANREVTEGNSFTIDYLPDEVYYFRVSACDKYGNYSEYSETQTFQVGPDQLDVSVVKNELYLNRYKNDNRDYILSYELKNNSGTDISGMYVCIMLSSDKIYGNDDYMLAGFWVDSLEAGKSIENIYKFNIPEEYLSGDYYVGVVTKDYNDNYQYHTEKWLSFNGENELEYYGTDVLLPNVMPQAEYMYGCTPTALAMILGYYDLYGYSDGTDLSNLIEGDIAVKSRGTDGSMYNMNAFDTVLGNFIATEDYVYRFYSREDIDTITAVGCGTNYKETTPEEELAYSFVNSGTTLNTSVWDCLSDYIGTGQYWRGQGNLSTSLTYDTLENIANSTSTRTFSGDGYTRTIDYKYTTLLYGLELYAQSRGYSLDYEITGTYATDNNGGSFTFEDYMAEIDAGRAVLISIEGHSLVGYGYNAKTREIIFDDDYTADQRMEWGKSYFYSGKNRALQSVTVIGFNTAEHVTDLKIVPSSGTKESLILATEKNAKTSAEYYFSGDDLYANFSVCNDSDYTCGSFSIALYVNDSKVKTFSITNMAANGVQEFNDVYLGKAETGKHTVKIKVDDLNNIQETTASNNTIEKNVQVLAPGTSIVSASKTVSSGSSINNAFVTTGGRLYVTGGIANRPIVMGELASSGADGRYWYYGAYIYARSGGVINDAQIQEYGYAYIEKNSYINRATVSYRGGINVSSGGIASDTHILSGGVQTVSSGGTANNTTIESGGIMRVYNGTAQNTIVSGYISGISSGTMLSGVTIHKGGYAYLISGAIMKDADISGSMYAAGSASIEDAVISSGGTMTISRAVVKSATVNGGWLNVSSGGTALNVSLGNNASMSLRDNAISSDTFIDIGAVVYCWPNGCLKGNLTIAGKVEDASAKTVSGVSDYKFILNNPDDSAFLSFSTGGFAANSNITVDVTNAWGYYVLIDGNLDNINTAKFTVSAASESINYKLNEMITLQNGKQVTISQQDTKMIVSVSGHDITAPSTPVDVKSTVKNNKLICSWKGTTDFSGVRYELEYSTKSDFSDAKSVFSFNDNVEVALPSGTWYWRLRSVDGAGNKSGWTSRKTQQISYTYQVSQQLGSTLSVKSDVTLQEGASITAKYPAALQVLDSGFTVNLEGNNSLYCSSIRNAAILFGDDASWEDTYGYGKHHDGIVNFNGTNISLYSDVSNCITAAGIIGNNLTVSFTGAASGAESITFEATNPPGGPGNSALAISAGNDLIIHGDFGGIVNNHFDFSDVDESNRRGVTVTGFNAGNDLIVNGNISGKIFLSALSTSYSYSYGLKATKTLTVTGEISGIIAATAEEYSYAIYGHEINVTVSGILFAGKSTTVNNAENIFNKLENFTVNQEELLNLAKGNFYAVRATGASNITFEGNALSIGTIYLSSNSVITIADNASIYGDISTYQKTNSVIFKLNSASLKNTRLVTSAWNSNIAIFVDAKDISVGGTYSLIETSKDFLSSTKVTLLIDQTETTLCIGESITVKNVKYILTQENTANGQTLNLVVDGTPSPYRNLTGNANGISWNTTVIGANHIVEYSSDNFTNSMRLHTSNNQIDTWGLPSETWQWRIKENNADNWTTGPEIVQNIHYTPNKFVSDKDGDMDVFFANASGSWESGYAAQHLGILNSWSGTNEQVILTDKNKLSDIFEGSTDTNILVMTDDANGDALFVDDIYTALPGTVAEQQARIVQIDEIRAGLGDDIVDMTSQRFEYVGDGVKIYGGLGNDTIWANNGENTLFGDAGNDRLVGGADNDVIAGGIGNDSMHGGGGEDIFCFGENWGQDTVEQLVDGKVTLWFESGSASNWNADTLTYTDGANSVTVSGVINITLWFGADTSLPAGCFEDAASEKIFEDKNKGFLA